VSLTAKALDLKFDLLPIDILHGAQLNPEFLEASFQKKKFNFYSLLYKQSIIVTLQMNVQHTLPTIQKDNFILSERWVKVIIYFILHIYV